MTKRDKKEDFMKTIRSFLTLLMLLSTQSFLFSMTNPSDPDMEDFVMVEVSNEPAKKASMDVEDAKKLITQANKKLMAVKSVAESAELNAVIKTSRSILDAIRKLKFKNGPGFEISNKTNSPIWMSVVSNGKIKAITKEVGCDQIDAHEKLAIDLSNLKENMKFGIYLRNPGEVTYSKETEEFMPAPHYVYETTDGAQGKTKYFTWNPEKHRVAKQYLYPQTGRWSGLAKGSSSGYLLTNNIKAHQLILTSTNELEEEETEE